MTEPDKKSDPMATIQMDKAAVTNWHVYVLKKIASTLDLEEVLKRVVEAAIHLSQADEGSLLLLDEATGELYMRAAKGFGEEYARTFRQKVTDDNIAGRVFLTGLPVLVGRGSGLRDQVKVKTGYLPQSVLNLPIKRGDTVYGVLGVYNSSNQRSFTHYHLELLTPLANYASIAIENARRFQEANDLLRDAYSLFELLEVNENIETLEPDDLLYFIASNAQGRLPLTDRVVIHLFNPQTGRLDFKVRVPHINNSNDHHRLGFAMNEGIAGRAFQENRLYNVPDVREEPLFDKHNILTGSLVVVPISRRNLKIGTISVASPTLNAFRRRDERFLSILANLAGIAIENSRLYARQIQLIKESQERLEAVERRNRELNSLRDILGALQSTLSLPEVLARIANGVIKGLNYQAVMLSTIDEAQQQLTVQEFTLEGGLAVQGLLELGQRLVGQKLIGNSASLTDHQENIGIKVCLDGRIRVTHNLHDIFRPVVGQKSCQILQKSIFKLDTFAVLPIRSENQLFGVLYAGTRRADVAPSDLQALQAFANQAALAIQNARQFERIHERLRRRMRELQSLQDIDRLITSTPDLEQLLRHILEVGLKLVNAESGNIVLADRLTGELIPKVSYPEGPLSPERYNPGLTAWVAQQRKTARVADLAETNWKNPQRNPPIRAELAAPLLLSGELVGVINMGSVTPGAFTEEDESLLDILATQTTVAIQTARYYQELEESRLRSLETERIVAMSDIASNMVHSINNSTGAVRVLVQQIRRKMAQGTLTDEFLTDKLESIEGSAEKTLAMSRSIRDPFRPMAAEPVAVNNCIKTALQSVEPIPSQIHLTLELGPDLPPVLATQQLAEVFRNLIKNAIEAMEGQGRLHLTSQAVNRMVEVTLSDSGPGLPPEVDAESIFKLGVSSKKNGLGYGLWWCKIFLNRFGGNIQVQPGLEAGCKFLVRLPLGDNPSLLQ